MENIEALVIENFPQLSESQLITEIARVGSIHHFRENEVIMDYGSFIKMVPLVLEGTVKVTREDENDAREILLYYLSGGATCSMSFSCCMSNKRSSIRTTAETDVRLIGIPIQYIDEWMSKYPSWKNFIMSSYDQRMLDLIYTIDSLAFQKLDDRLYEYLEKRQSAIGGKSLHVTHQQIADDLTVSREAVSRLLKSMERAGLVKLGRNQVQLLG